MIRDGSLTSPGSSGYTVRRYPGHSGVRTINPKNRTHEEPYGKRGCDGCHAHVDNDRRWRQEMAYLPSIYGPLLLESATFEQHDQGVRGFVIDSMSPESATSTHYFWGMARNFDTVDAGFTARFKHQQGGVFLEDVEVLEAQQRSIVNNPSAKLRAFSIDTGSVRARQIIDRLSQGRSVEPSPD
jgi:phenylpropionate dioxygenase-like ring-hydroxylating dioxygenase large terminal subunit